MAIKSKRVFTKWMGKGVVPPNDDWISEVAMEWVVQEDIEIIAVELCGFAGPWNENDHHVYGHFELTQAGVKWSDGIIAALAMDYFWNTAPASAARSPDNVFVHFPEGHAIPVKEEGHVNLIVDFYMEGAAGEEYIHCDAIIYYIKK